MKLERQRDLPTAATSTPYSVADIFEKSQPIFYGISPGSACKLTLIRGFPLVFLTYFSSIAFLNAHILNDTCIYRRADQ